MYRINSITPRRFWLAVGVLVLIFAAAVFAAPLRRASRLEPRIPSQLADDGEILLDSTFHYTLISGTQYQPSVSAGNANCLVVWDNSAGIMAGRVTDDGRVLDSLAITIPGATMRDPTGVAFNGANYLVVWNFDSGLRAARIAPTGVVLDSPPMRISNIRPDGYAPHLASDGNDWLVVYRDNRSSAYALYGTRVSAFGQVLDTMAIFVADSAMTPDVAWNGTNYLVAWSDQTASPDVVKAVRVTVDGSVLNPPLRIGPASPSSYLTVATASDGANWLVAWLIRNDSTSDDIYAARVSPGAELLDTAAIPVSKAASYQRYPSVAWNGSNYLIAWQDRRNGATNYNIYGARVTQSGALLDPDGLPICTFTRHQELPVVTAINGNWFAVWEDRRSGRRIYGTRIDPSGGVLDSSGIAISLGPQSQDQSALAFDGSNYLAVWQDNRNAGTTRIYGARFSAGGTLVDPAPFPISPSTAAQSYPDVAFDGANYLVVWADGRGANIYGRRVSPAGIPLDTDDVRISLRDEEGPKSTPAVAFNGSDYLVAWTDYDTAALVHAARVSPAGIVLDTAPITLYRTGGETDFPALVADGEDWLVTWWSDLDSAGYYAARISRYGVLLDSVPLLFLPAQPADYMAAPVAFDGANYFIVWQSEDSSAEVFGLRVRPDGVRLDSSPILLAASGDAQYNPALAFDGTSYIAVWEDDSTAALSGVHVTPTGQVESPFNLTAPGAGGAAPALAQGSANHAAASFSWPLGPYRGRNYSVSRIWAKLTPFSGISEGNARELKPQAMTIRPNPCRGRLEIRIRASAIGNRQSALRVFDPSGRLIRRLPIPVTGTPATNLLFWEGKDQHGRSVANGVYLLRLETDGATETRAVLMLK